MDEQVVAVIRAEDAGVSHDGLLATNGHSETRAEYRRLTLAGVAPSSFYRTEHFAATCELAPRPESAKVARDFTRLTLRGWRMARLSDVAELVVSELVTNALRHGLLSARWMPGEHPIRLRLLRQLPYLMCMVTDPDTAGPVRVDSHSGAESGRGLQVVETCSVRWGWQRLDALDEQMLDGRGGRVRADGGRVWAGKVVWALLQSPDLRRITGR
jgi:anti-sigma regulatory factor (Ser/Thr protein kinase)